MVLNDRKDKLVQLLDNYEELVEQLQQVESFESLDRHGAESVGGLHRLAREIQFLWESLPESELDADLEDRIRTLDAERDRLVSSPAAREQAREELEYALDRLPVKTCNFMDMGPIFHEVPQFLSWLDRTLILLEELDEYFDLTEEWIRFETLEEVIRCKYEHGVDTILEECPRIERTWYPERFWWRHPTKILEERDW